MISSFDYLFFDGNEIDFKYIDKTDINSRDTGWFLFYKTKFVFLF